MIYNDAKLFHVHISAEKDCKILVDKLVMTDAQYSNKIGVFITSAKMHKFWTALNTINQPYFNN
jgi:hypothetical protein